LNIYAYVRGNPISKKDPSGRVEWEANSYTVSWGWNQCERYTFKSKCQNGKQFIVKVVACGVGPGVGWFMGGSVGGSFSDDNYSPDPNVFNGPYFSASAGGAGGIGGQVGATLVGGATSVGGGAIAGIGGSVGVTVGSSFVESWEEKSCGTCP
jgi:hypothetical protein